MDYYSSSANPAWSIERFWEAHDLVVRAWTETGPFPWQGEHYHLQFVNPWPRPLQSRTLPIWLPGTGAVELIETRGRAALPFMMVLAAHWFTKAAFDAYREAAELRLRVDPPSSAWRYRSTWAIPTTQRTARRGRTSSGCSRPG